MPKSNESQNLKLDREKNSIKNLQSWFLCSPLKVKDDHNYNTSQHEKWSLRDEALTRKPLTRFVKIQASFCIYTKQMKIFVWKICDVSATIEKVIYKFSW